MAEIKNAFLKAKMNKDLEDRLMPKGEYRHAVNIQVSTTEHSDMGSLQNVLGNGIEVGFTDSPSGSTCIGFLTDESRDEIYLFVTDNDSTGNNATKYYTRDNEDFSSDYTGKNSFHFIYKYNVESGILETLIEGAFLNFHKDYPITGVNLLEEILFWTDNRNQPRRANVGRVGEYYSEDQISVAKYNPYESILVYNESELVPGEYETSMKDVKSMFTLEGGNGFVNGDFVNETVIDIDQYVIEKYPNEISAGMTVHKVDSQGNIVPLTQGVTEYPNIVLGVGAMNTVSDKLTLPQAVDLNDDEELIFNANPYFINNYPGDPKINEDKFLRFSYRFKFDDGEYSLMAPFTQICFIPRQDGYFMVGDEEQAFSSSIVEFMQNKVNEVKLSIPLPFSGSTIKNELHVQEIDILSSESDSNTVKVIETVSIDDLSSLDSDVYQYTYQSKQPYKTLPTIDTTRVYDKIPVRALAQEIVSNRVVYGNYQDKHTPPPFINYNVAVTKKNDFNVHNLTTVSRNTFVDTTDRIAISATPEQASELLLGSSVKIYDPGFVPPAQHAVILEIEDDPQNSGSRSFITLNKVITIQPTSGIVIEAPEDAKSTSAKEYPNSGTKTNRNYQAGILLSDRFGRHSTVILSNSRDAITIGDETFSGSTIYSEYPGPDVDINSWFGNSIKMLFNETIGPTQPNPYTKEPGIYNGDINSPDYNPLGWYSYKVVVKQTEQEYYNVYTAGAMKGIPSSNGDVSTYNQSFITLINDNINKVPRDLSLVGPQDRKFRSSVRLFGRVENNDSKNVQFFNNSDAFTVGAIQTLKDTFDIDSSTDLTDTSSQYYPFYKGESDPLVAFMSTSQTIDNQFGIGNAVASYDPINNAEIYDKINTLAVFETNPFESKLDIFWETSTSGRLDSLNNLIRTDSSGPDDLGGWITTNFSENPGDVDNNGYLGSGDGLFSITGAGGFYVLDGLGTTIPKASNSTTGIVVNSLILTSVQTADTTPVEVYSSAVPRFELESHPSNETWKIWALEPTSPTSNNSWVYTANSDKSKSYVFYFTVETEDLDTGEVTTSHFTKYASLENASPQFTDYYRNVIVPPTSFSKTTLEDGFMHEFYVDNGASFDISEPTFTFSGIYTGINSSIKTYDSNGTLLTNGLAINTEIYTVSPPKPHSVKVFRPNNFDVPGDYTATLTITDAGGAFIEHDFAYELTDGSCLVLEITNGSHWNYTGCDGVFRSSVYFAAGTQLLYKNGTTAHNSNGNNNNFNGSCFVAGSKVKVLRKGLFVDVNIEEVLQGETLLGVDGGINKVIYLDRPPLYTRRLCDINKNNDFFFSEEHPMLTTTGWKTLDPSWLKKNEEGIWKELFEGRSDIILSIGDEMIMYDGSTTVVEHIDFKEADANTQLYNFVLDGDNTYVVNGYVVHNT